MSVLRVATRKAKLFLRDFATLQICKVFLESVDLAKEKEVLMDMGRVLGRVLVGSHWNEDRVAESET